jgi:hypothetical protein
MLSHHFTSLFAKLSRASLKSVGVLACVVLASSLVSSTRASVLWSADTSRGTAVFSSLEKSPGNITVTNDPLGSFGQVYRYDTWDDSAYSKERCESKGTVTPSGAFHLQLNTEYYIGWREMWNPMPIDPGWVALFQMHGYGPSGQGAPLVLRCTNGDGTVGLQNNVNGTNIDFWKTPFRTGIWNNFVLHLFLSTDATKGWVELWYNGVRQTFTDGSTRFICPLWDEKPGSSVELKWGVYRSGAMNGKGNASTFLSGAKIGTTFADVDPLAGSVVADPVFAPAGGTYTSVQSVSLSSTTSGASIRYTTDGSTPSATAGTSYTGPITISATTTVKAIAYKSGMTASNVITQKYTIGASSTLAWEAEALSRTTSGVTATTDTDSAASGGARVTLNAVNTGSWVEFTLPNVPAGTYALKLTYKTNNNRGIATTRVNGATLSGTLDQYASSASYPTATLGTVTFASTGNQLVRLVVSGKNSSSSGYTLSADKITLTAQ